MMNSKWLLIGGILAIAGCHGWAQDPDISAFPNPVGSGARAAGMGDAFISIADDATAGSWNPAGLILLERPEFSIVGESVLRRDDWNFERNRFDYDFNPDNLWSHSLNFASLTYPLRLGETNIVTSISLQKAYRFDREYDFRYEDTSMNQFRTLDFQQEGALYTVSPAAAIRLTPRLSLGATVNFWMDDIENSYAWKTRIHGTGSLTFGGEYDVVHRERFEDVFGVNFNLGLRYEATENLTLGAVFRSPFEAKLKRRRVETGVFQGEPAEPQIEREDGELDFPWTVGVGASWRFNDHFTTSLDVVRTDWEHFTYSDEGAGDNSVDRHLVTGLDPDRADVEPTWSVRSGMEYLFVGRQHVVPLRWGLAYDPQPSRDDPDTMWVASAGTGLVWGDRLSLDAAYQYRFGDADAGPGFGEIEVRQHRFLVSMIVYW